MPLWNLFILKNIQITSSTLESETLFSKEMLGVGVGGHCPHGQTPLALARAWLLSATFERSQHLWYEWIYFKRSHLVGRTAGISAQVRERSHEPKRAARWISKCKSKMYPSVLTHPLALGLKLWHLGGNGLNTVRYQLNWEMVICSWRLGCQGSDALSPAVSYVTQAQSSVSSPIPQKRVSKSIQKV